MLSLILVDHLSYLLRELEVGFCALIPSEFITLHLKHVVEDLDPQEQFLFLFLEVLLSDYFKCLFIGERLLGQWVDILGLLTGD